MWFKPGNNRKCCHSCGRRVRVFFSVSRSLAPFIFTSFVSPSSPSVTWSKKTICIYFVTALLSCTCVKCHSLENSIWKHISYKKDNQNWRNDKLENETEKRKQSKIVITIKSLWFVLVHFVRSKCTSPDSTHNFLSFHSVDRWVNTNEEFYHWKYVCVCM